MNHEMDEDFRAYLQQSPATKEDILVVSKMIAHIALKLDLLMSWALAQKGPRLVADNPGSSQPEPAAKRPVGNGAQSASSPEQQPPAPAGAEPKPAKPSSPSAVIYRYPKSRVPKNDE